MSRKQDLRGDEHLCEICGLNTADHDRDYMVLKNTPDTFECLPIVIRLCKHHALEAREIAKAVKFKK